MNASPEVVSRDVTSPDFVRARDDVWIARRHIVAMRPTKVTTSPPVWIIEAAMTNGNRCLGRSEFKSDIEAAIHIKRICRLRSDEL